MSGLGGAAAVTGWRRPRGRLDVAGRLAGAGLVVAWVWSVAGSSLLPLAAMTAASAAAVWTCRARPVLAAQIVVAAAASAAPGLAVLLDTSWQSGQTATLLVAGFAVAGPAPTVLAAVTGPPNQVLAAVGGTIPLLAALTVASVVGPERVGTVALLAGVAGSLAVVWVFARRPRDVGEEPVTAGLPPGWADVGPYELRSGAGGGRLLAGPGRFVVVLPGSGRARPPRLAAAAAAGHTLARELGVAPAMIQPLIVVGAAAPARKYAIGGPRGGVVLAVGRSQLPAALAGIPPARTGGARR